MKTFSVDVTFYEDVAMWGYRIYDTGTGVKILAAVSPGAYTEPEIALLRGLDFISVLYTVCFKRGIPFDDGGKTCQTKTVDRTLAPAELT